MAEGGRVKTGMRDEDSVLGGEAFVRNFLTTHGNVMRLES
jgi:hypothetical protein